MRLEYSQLLSAQLDASGDFANKRSIVEKGILSLEQGNMEPLLDIYTDDAITQMSGLPPSKPTRESKSRFFSWLINANESMDFSRNLKSTILKCFWLVALVNVDGDKVFVQFQLTFKLKDGTSHKVDFNANHIKDKGSDKLTRSDVTGDVSTVLPLWVKHTGQIPTEW
ncbi:hypothetical protein FA15DRAFT_659530 [Coprinopsis marcescibilis]|uniref:SnoaL-like domain-containing protein n=1 Tax=Coprinopsis marcescibilis TaxID=230819 RepID=A0A5C3KIF8_COPMA|nr:hypothetical protein FA15DRAFT_659530 [Coprinopsis marcescibilis]